MMSRHTARMALLIAVTASLHFGHLTKAADETESNELPVITSGKVLFLKAGQEVETWLIEEGASLILEHEHRIVRVDGFDQDELSVEALNPKRLRIKAKDVTPQQTLVLTDEFDNRMTIQIDIVSRSIRPVSKYLRQLFPDAKLELYGVGDSLLIRGTARSADQLMEIYEIAGEFFPNVLKHARLEGLGNLGLHNEIPLGMRVVSVKVNVSQTHSQTLAPKDRVDVLVSYQTRDTLGVNIKVKPLLEYVEVFAPPRYADSGQTASVSLLVTPEQASFVQLAEKKGELQLVMRNRTDDEQVQVGGIDHRLLQELRGEADRDVEFSVPTPKAQEPTADVAPANDLKTDIHALHTDVKRLIELLEQRQAKEVQPEDEISVPSRAIPKKKPRAQESEVWSPPEIQFDVGPAGTFSGRVRIVGDLPEVKPLVEAEDLSKRARRMDEDIPDESLLVGKDGELANVFVYPRQLPEDIEAPNLKVAPITFTSRACRFVPHCSIVHAGQTVLMKNDDPIMCHVHTSPLRNRALSQVIAPNEVAGVPYSYQRPERGATRIQDDMHPWKRAYHLVVDHNFAALTDEEGWFEIHDLPPGSYEYHLWHERVGYIHLNFPLTMHAEKGVTAEITKSVDAATFSRKPRILSSQADF